MSENNKQEYGGLIPLLSTAFRFECRSITPSNGKLRLVGRVAQNKVHSDAWMKCVAFLLDFKGAASLDVSKHYFRQNGETYWAWRVIISAPNLEEACEEIAQALRPKALQKEYVPLDGVTARVESLPTRGVTGPVGMPVGPNGPATKFGKNVRM